jgi:hypothetical protein
VCRKWEAGNARADLYGGREMGSQRAAWTASFGAEAAAAGGGQALLAVEGAKNMCMEEKDKCWNNEK